MDESPNGYHISFFKPTTPQALANRNMVLWLISIWVIAIFGFQILLRIIEKPTPEPAFVSFQTVWANVENGSFTQDELSQFGQASLSVLSKISIIPEDAEALENALSWSLYQLCDESLRTDFVSEVKDFEKIKSSIDNIADPTYLEKKIALTNKLGPMLKLSPLDVRSKILPLELSSGQMDKLSDATIKSLPGIMEKYLIHNQSVLTDTKFLGYPFHYFYTAVFLLILFVGLCWLYCVRTDNQNGKMNIAD
jgi:putative solute:sodium symporter small subunit